MRKIREANESDFYQIHFVVSDAVRQCVTDSDEHHKSICADVRECLDWWIENKENGLLLVCEEGESISGMAFVKGFWNFAALFVDPCWHRRGIGRELTAAVFEVCRHKSPKGYLRVNSSTYAVDFYRKMGFVQIEEALDRPGGCVPLRYDFI